MANEIVPNVWISDLDTALHPGFIRDCGIKRVINVTEMAPFITEVTAVPKLDTFRIPISDVASEQWSLLESLPKAVDLIHESVTQGNPVLVHCHMGISRSCTVVAAYLLKHCPDCTTVADAVRHVQSRRPQAFKYGLVFENVLKAFYDVYCRAKKGWQWPLFKQSGSAN